MMCKVYLVAAAMLHGIAGHGHVIHTVSQHGPPLQPPQDASSWSTHAVACLLCARIQLCGGAGACIFEICVGFGNPAAAPIGAGSKRCK